MKTIFNTYINVGSQEQADRLKKVCIDNGLPYWEDKCAFSFIFKANNKFGCGYYGDFYVGIFSENHTQVTESEWLELLEEYKLTLK